MTENSRGCSKTYIRSRLQKEQRVHVKEAEVMNMNQVMETKNAESTEVAAQKQTQSRHEVHKVCQTHDEDI